MTTNILTTVPLGLNSVWENRYMVSIFTAFHMYIQQVYMYQVKYRGIQWNLRIMKVLGQPIFFIIWRCSLLRGTNVLKCMQMVHWKNFIMRGFSLLLSEVPLYYISIIFALLFQALLYSNSIQQICHPICSCYNLLHLCLSSNVCGR